MCEQVQLADDKKNWENINAISFYRSWWVFAMIFKEKKEGQDIDSFESYSEWPRQCERKQGLAKE